MTGGRLGRWACRNTMLRHGRACDAIRPRRLRHGARGTTYDTVWRALRYNRVCARHAHNTIGGRPRYDQGEAVTLRLVHHDTAGPARSGRAAWVRVCTWCTQPSFGLNTLFQSLFGPLFMNIVHKIFQKIKKIKNKKNKKIKK